ncbi:MAG: beta-galactosidase [Anaerolineaceae bacterium]|nr:beta-galactosidase [Anaerolineaceae bacterium]
MIKSTPFIKGKQLHFNGRTIPMLSGEVHYWRINPQEWRTVLERVKEMGIQMVATYVCWEFHEVTPGELDFNGVTDPRRDLVAFLSLLQEMDFDIIVRPGPYIYSEWKNNGIPDRMTKYHRLDPLFLSEADDYIQAVVKVIKPFLASNGGRIVLLQAENEIDPWPALFTEPLGLGKNPGLFQQFLKEQYESIEALNKIWISDYSNFEQAHAVCVLPGDQTEKLVRYLDFVRFKHWFVRRAAEWAVSVYRQAGVDVPIILNGYDGTGTQHWGEMEHVADVYGQDIYPSNEFAKWPDEFRFLLEKARFARAISRLPYIGEFEAGVWHGWHYLTGALTANHYRMAAIGAWAGGIVGWNWYMLVNRDNWYMSPINEWGRTRPELFSTFKKIVDVYQVLEPATLSHPCKIGVTIDPLQRSLVRPGEPVLKAIHAAGLDYEFFDLWAGTWDAPVVFYAGGSWLSRSGQERLLAYVRSGGHLVLMGLLPEYDEFLLKHKSLPVNRGDGVIPINGAIKVRLNDHEFVYHSNRAEWFETVPGKTIIATRVSTDNLSSEELVYQHSLEQGQEYKIGFTVQEGQGMITYLGLDVNPGLLKNILIGIEIVQPIECSIASWTVALYERAESKFITVINPNQMAGSCEIRLNDRMPDGIYMIHDLMTDYTWNVPAMNGKLSLICSLPAKDATVLQILRQDL